MIQRVVFKFILPLLIFAVVLGTIQSITDHSLDPRHDSLIDQLNEFNREVPIGEPDQHGEEEAEEVLRGVTTFNMLAAQNCLYPGLIYNAGESLDNDHPDIEDISDEEREFLENLEHYNEDWQTVKDTRESHGQFSFFNHDNPLKFAIDETNFAGTCLGASPMPMHDDFTSAAVENMIQIGKYAGCAASGLLGCGVAYLGLQVKDLWEGDHTQLRELEGHAAQGMFGQIEFTAHENITIEDERLMYWDLGEWAVHEQSPDALGIGWSDVEPSPDFTRGRRAAVFLPDGIGTTDSTENWISNEVASEGTSANSVYRDQNTLALRYNGVDEAAPDPGWISSTDSSSHVRRRMISPYAHWGDWGQAFNAFRVRMVDVPTFVTDFDEDYFFDEIPEIAEDEAENHVFPDESTVRIQTKMQYEYIMERVEFRICEGAYGRIQSNAVDIDESGKPSSDERVVRDFRDVVFPKVEILEWTEGSSYENCVEQHSGVNNYGNADKIDDDTFEWFDGEIVIAD